MEKAQEWTYEEGHWPQIRAYIDMVEEIRQSGFRLSELTLDKLDFAKHLALESLESHSSLDPDKEAVLHKIIGDVDAILDTFRS